MDDYTTLTGAADITLDYKKVKWDSIGITEKLLGLQGASQKNRHKVVWDSIVILEGFLKKRFGITLGLQK